jgi:hypothetical protein
VNPLFEPIPEAVAVLDRVTGEIGAIQDTLVAHTSRPTPIFST